MMGESCVCLLSKESWVLGSFKPFFKISQIFQIFWKTVSKNDDGEHCFLKLFGFRDKRTCTYSDIEEVWPFKNQCLCRIHLYQITWNPWTEGNGNFHNN